MDIINQTWPNFKSTVTAKSLRIQYVEDSLRYSIFAVESNIQYETEIIKDADTTNIRLSAAPSTEKSWQSDFETNYKSTSNQAITSSNSTSPGSATPSTAMMVAGSDGTNLRAIKVSTDGKVEVDNISGTISLPTGAATESTISAMSTKLTDATQKTKIVDGSGNVISSTSNAIDINIKSGVSLTASSTLATGDNTVGRIKITDGTNVAGVTAISAVKVDENTDTILSTSTTVGAIAGAITENTAYTYSGISTTIGYADALIAGNASIKAGKIATNDFVIPNGQTWRIKSALSSTDFIIASNTNQGTVVLQYGNPAGTMKTLAQYSVGGYASNSGAIDVGLTGDGTKVLRVLHKNMDYNGSSTGKDFGMNTNVFIEVR